MTAWVRIERLTRRLFSKSRVRNWVGVGCQGGKIRLGGGEQFLDVLTHGGLVILGRQQVIGPCFQHQVAAGLGLGVQRVQRNEPVFQIQVLEELACDRDFIGLGLHDRAAQVILAGHADGREDSLAATMLGFFAIQGDQFVLGGRPTELRLNVQDDLFQLGAIDLLLEAAEGRLAGGGVTALLVAANAKARRCA